MCRLKTIDRHTLLQLTPKEESAHAHRLLPRMHQQGEPIHEKALHGHPAGHHGHCGYSSRPLAGVFLLNRQQRLQSM